MTTAISTGRSRTWGSVAAKFAEWVAVTCVAAIAVFFAASMVGFHMDYVVNSNRVLVWSVAAGGAGFSVWYGWIVSARGTHGRGVWVIPGSRPGAWALSSGAVLWLAAALVDRSRLDLASVEYGELVPRVPAEWGMWVPLAVIAACSLLSARRSGLVRWGLASLPIQILWWWAVLLASQ